MLQRTSKSWKRRLLTPQFPAQRQLLQKQQNYCCCSLPNNRLQYNGFTHMREQAEVNQSRQTEVCSLAGPLFVDITGFVEEQIIYLVLQLNVSVWLQTRPLTGALTCTSFHYVKAFYKISVSVIFAQQEEPLWAQTLMLDESTESQSVF